MSLLGVELLIILPGYRQLLPFIFRHVCFISSRNMAPVFGYGHSQHQIEIRHSQKDNKYQIEHVIKP